MSDVKLGTFPGADIARDAVHVAIISLMADNYLMPGEPVGWAEKQDHVSKYAPTKFGIVDPFLQVVDKIEPGTRIWVLLYPASITSLRHVWSHPAIADEPASMSPKDEAEKRLRQLAASVETSYEDFLGLLEEDNVFFGEECYHLYEHEDQIKKDFQTITGSLLPKLPSFRCAC